VSPVFVGASARFACMAEHDRLVRCSRARQPLGRHPSHADNEVRCVKRRGAATDRRRMVALALFAFSRARPPGRLARGRCGTERPWAILDWARIAAAPGHGRSVSDPLATTLTVGFDRPGVPALLLDAYCGHDDRVAALRKQRQSRRGCRVGDEAAASPGLSARSSRRPRVLLFSGWSGWPLGRVSVIAISGVPRPALRRTRHS